MLGQELAGGLHIATLPDGKRLILSPKVYEKKLAYADISLFESLLMIGEYSEWFVPDADLMKYILQHYAIIKDDMIDGYDMHIDDGYDMHIDEEYWTVNDNDVYDYAETVIFVTKGGIMYYNQKRGKKNVYNVRAFKLI
jgi:hypothetical protein